MKASINIFITILTLAISLISCNNKPSELSTKFSCDKHPKLGKLEAVKDFNKNFKVKIPKYWKTELYYDNIQSEIFTADTIKSLSNTYIMDFSMITSLLKIDDDLVKKIHNKNMENDLKTVEEYFYSFKEKKAYSNVSKGKSKDLDFYVFQTYIKVSDEKYMLIKVEFYGEESFKSRLCEAIGIINEIQFIN